MKKCITILILILYISLIYTAQNIYAQKSKILKFTIFFDKNEYNASDNAILISFKLKNISNNQVYVNKRFYLNSDTSDKEYRDAYLEVKSPKGELLPCKVSYPTGLPRTADFVLLNPNEEIEAARSRNIKYYYDFNEAGRYKITAIYENAFGKEIGVDAFKEKIESDTIAIDILK